MRSDRAMPSSDVSSGRDISRNQRKPTTAYYYFRMAAHVLLMFVILGPLVASARGAKKDENQVVFLVARRQVQDPYFYHSVVLMLPSVKSPLIVGLIVNKPTRMDLGELFPQTPAFKNRTDHAFFGGPVDVGVVSVAFHSQKAPEHAFHVYGDVYLTFDSNLISSVFQNPHSGFRLRLFLGRSQWGHGQLQNEMREGGWYQLRAAGSLIFSTEPQNLWRMLYNRAKPSNYIKYESPSDASPRFRVQSCIYMNRAQSR